MIPAQIIIIFLATISLFLWKNLSRLIEKGEIRNRRKQLYKMAQKNSRHKEELKKIPRKMREKLRE